MGEGPWGFLPLSPFVDSTSAGDFLFPPEASPRPLCGLAQLPSFFWISCPYPQGRLGCLGSSQNSPVSSGAKSCRGIGEERSVFDRFQTGRCLLLETNGSDELPFKDTSNARHKRLCLCPCLPLASRASVPSVCSLRTKRLLCRESSRAKGQCIFSFSAALNFERGQSVPLTFHGNTGSRFN